MSLVEGLGAGNVLALGWTLVHFLWQGALAAGLLMAAEALLRPRSAHARYAFAVATMAVMAALPAVTFARLRTQVAATAAAEARGAPAVTVETTAGVVDGAAPLSSAPAAGGPLSAALPALVLLWSAGVAVLSARSLGGWVLVQRLKRSGQPGVPEPLAHALERLRRRIGLTRAVRLWQSALVEVPTVIGWIRPVILLPASALTGLTTAQLELILAHELAHVRRFDYLVNLLQTIVETLLFYHPAVWWVSGRIRTEREHCCDDAAVAACGDVLSYARALTELEGLRGALPVMAVAATGGSLTERVRRLVGPPAHVHRSSRWVAGLVVAASVGVAAAAPVLRGGAGGSALEATPSDEAEPARPLVAPLADAAPPGAEGSLSGRERRPVSARARETAGRQGRETAPNLPVEKILELLQAGVTPEYVEGMVGVGYPSLSFQQLIDLRRHGVGHEYVKGLADQGYTALSPDRLVQLRSRGVTPDFARGLRAQGLSGLSVSDLVDLRSHGVTPDYVSGMKKAGYGGETSVTRLLSLRSQGVTPEYVSALAALGHRDLSSSRLIALRSQGVTAEYVRELNELGYAHLSVSVLMGLRSQGVSPDYVRELKELGYAGLDPGQLIELRSQGVTPEFVRELKESGYTRLTPTELVELRSQGVRVDLLRRLRGVLMEKGGAQ